jgi:hypothetical protein
MRAISATLSSPESIVAVAKVCFARTVLVTFI